VFCLSLLCFHLSTHYKEPGCFRAAYEPLLVRHGVDIVMSGHVHAYERTKPLNDYQVCTLPTVLSTEVRAAAMVYCCFEIKTLK
jgi:hypothetical protein